MQLLTPILYLFLELIQGAFWIQNGKNVRRIVKIVHSASFFTTFFLVGFLSHTAPPEEKLSPDDAQFVDVIHSAGLWMGTDEKVYNK